MIDLDSYHLKQLKEILERIVPGVEVRVIGSRISGKAKTYSDIDLVLVGQNKLDWRLLESLKDAFSESELPFRVDVVDWYDVSESFRTLIEKKYEVIQQGKTGDGDAI